MSEHPPKQSREEEPLSEAGQEALARLEREYSLSGQAADGEGVLSTGDKTKEIIAKTPGGEVKGRLKVSRESTAEPGKKAPKSVEPSTDTQEPLSDESNEKENDEAQPKDLRSQLSELRESASGIDVEKISTVVDAEKAVEALTGGVAQLEATLASLRESIEKHGNTSPDKEESPELAKDKQQILQSIIDENNAALAEALTPEQRKVLQDIIDENNAALATEAGAMESTEASNEVAAEAARTAKRQERIAAADTAMGETELGVIDHLQAKLDEYAARKADVETGGGEAKNRSWMFWQAGRQKRGEALTAAEAALFAAHTSYVTKLIEKRQAAGVFEGLEGEELEKAMASDLFEELRKLDGVARKATLQNRLERAEGGFHKFMSKCGNWLNGGKDNKRSWLRNAGAGAATGGLVATGAVLSGAGWPITAGAALGLREGVRHMSKTAELDKGLESYNTNGMSDEEFDKYRRSLAQPGANVNAHAQQMAQEFFGKARAEGDEKLNAARKVAKDKVKKFSVGYAAAGIGVHAGNWLMSHDAAAQSAPTHSGSNSQGPGYNFHDGADYSSAPTPTTPDTVPNFEFPVDASQISPGEGWYHQFADMGLTQQQAELLFSDHDLMNKLVEQGAAYVDNSATIGGYGISMPASGNLSPEVMNTIRQAIVAKGF